jgi:hypothetical protein
MKQCPNCKTTYTDETLSFCLADGASLVTPPPDNEETLVMPFARNSPPARFADSSPTVFTPVNPHPPTEKKSASLFIVAGLIGVLLLIVLGLAASVGYFLLRPDEKKTVADTVSPTPIPVISPKSATTPDETANLKEKLANLEQQIQAQKNQKPIAAQRTYPNQTPTAGNLARVNSPNDGFLALRNAPDSETGKLLTKIPHGASVTVLGCPKPSNVGKIPGHWCQIVYDGQTGWAFDAFLIR